MSRASKLFCDQMHVTFIAFWEMKTTLSHIDISTWRYSHMTSTLVRVDGPAGTAQMFSLKINGFPKFCLPLTSESQQALIKITFCCVYLINNCCLSTFSLLNQKMLHWCSDCHWSFGPGKIGPGGPFLPWKFWSGGPKLPVKMVRHWK